MLHRHSRRLAALEQAAHRAPSVSFGSVLGDMLSYGMMRAAVALVAQRRYGEARELIEIAALERGTPLTDRQIDAALQHIVKCLSSHLTSFAQFPVRYWVRSEQDRHEGWRKDAAFLARNRGEPESWVAKHYAETVEYWRQQDGETSDERIARQDSEHVQRVLAIAQRLVQLRQERGQTRGIDVEAVARELLKLEASISPME